MALQDYPPSTITEAMVYADQRSSPPYRESAQQVVQSLLRHYPELSPADAEQIRRFANRARAAAEFVTEFGEVSHQIQRQAPVIPGLEAGCHVDITFNVNSDSGHLIKEGFTTIVLPPGTAPIFATVEAAAGDSIAIFAGRYRPDGDYVISDLTIVAIVGDCG